MKHTIVIASAVLLAVVSGAAWVVGIGPHTAQAAACTPPSTDYGTVTLSANVTATKTYRIWTRMAAPDTTHTTYLLQVDTASCYTVGGSAVPTYASGSNARFKSGKTNWISKTNAGSYIDVPLSSGSHTLKLIGTSDGVVIDRVIVTADTACEPTGAGTNCATQFVVADINQDNHVDFIDFSQLANKYNQSGGSIGRTDINGDGTVNLLDYSILANQYGQ